jgi:hypothetical protein
MQLMGILNSLTFKKKGTGKVLSHQGQSGSVAPWQKYGRIYDTALLSGHDWQLGNGKRMAPPLLGV